MLASTTGGLANSVFSISSSSEISASISDLRDSFSFCSAVILMPLAVTFDSRSQMSRSFLRKFFIFF